MRPDVGRESEPDPADAPPVARVCWGGRRSRLQAFWLVLQLQDVMFEALSPVGLRRPRVSWRRRSVVGVGVGMGPSGVDGADSADFIAGQRDQVFTIFAPTPLSSWTCRDGEEGCGNHGQGVVAIPGVAAASGAGPGVSRASASATIL
jgi:hypothetical protein